MNLSRNPTRIVIVPSINFDQSQDKGLKQEILEMAIHHLKDLYSISSEKWMYLN